MAPLCFLFLFLLLLSLVNFALFIFQTLMSVLITMGRVPISVTIQKVVIIVSVPLDINFNLTIIIVKVNNLIGFTQFKYILVY